MRHVVELVTLVRLVGRLALLSVRALHQVEVLPVIAVLPVVELVASHAVELQPMARIGGRCWPIYCTWSSWWPDRW